MSQDVRADEEVATQRRAQILGLNYINTYSTQKPLFKDILPIPELYQLRVVPLNADKSNILFGITTTTSQQTMNSLTRRFTDQLVKFAIISETGYREYLRLYDPPKKIEYQDININAVTDQQNLITNISATLDQVRADDILAYLVKQAYQLKASDIHLENQKNNVRIRFRIDGVLHSIANLSHDKYRQLLSAVAIAANVSTEASDGQTGHINNTYRMATGENVNVNLRVETVPTAYGQDVVMRLFTLKVELLKLDKLGLSNEERKAVDDVITHPTGMVLVVGPTGSGKTTTLYSLINTLNTDERKIITLEDPVEYFMEGVVQIPVQGDVNSAGFAEKLRAVLRLDPDVVMVGEIRDQDTARTSLQAALTGHLVLSTFHASSAAAALTRMLDFIGINPLFASAIHLIMAQRLVRRLDDSSKVPYKLDEGTLKQLQSVVDSMPSNVAKPNLAETTFYKPGKSDSNPFGFSGQIAIREQLNMTDGVQKLLRLPPNEVTTPILEKQAVADGMLTMLQDGLLKAAAGLTTIEEVYRVVG